MDNEINDNAVADIEAFRNQLNPLLGLERQFAELEQVETPLTHIFSGGVYLRQMEIPAGTIVIGKRHRHATCNILLKGSLLIYMGPDEPTKRIDGPFIFESAPEVKKMVCTLTDVIFMNIHPTKETDLEKIEAEVIIPEDEYVEKRLEEETKQCLGD